MGLRTAETITTSSSVGGNSTLLTGSLLEPIPTSSIRTSERARADLKDTKYCIVASATLHYKMAVTDHPILKEPA